MTESLPRPRQVTLAAWSIMFGSVVVVISGFETITGLHSMETREAIESALSTAPASGLGLDVGAVQQVIRVASMVAAGCATAAAVLGYQVLQRNRTARVVLSILAVPLFVAGIATGGFFSSLVAVAVAMLWLHPARSWFDGSWRPDADRTGQTPRSTEPDLPPFPPPGSSPGTAQPPAPEPRAVPGFGTAPPATAAPPDAGPSWPPATGAPPAPAGPWPGGAVPGYPVPGAPPGWPIAGPPARAPRPAALVWAAVLTWVCAGLAFVSTAVAVLVLATDAGPVLDELHRQQPELAAEGVSDNLILTVTYVMAAVVAVWSLAAMVLAGLAFAGFSWARITLLVCVAGTAALLLFSVVVGQLVLLAPLVATVATWTLLARPEVRRWCAERRGPMRA